MNKKIIALLIILAAAMFILSACGNRQMIDTTYSFNKAYIKIGSDWKLVDVKGWRDFDNGDEIQIQDTSGTTYLTHYSNVVMVKDQ